MTALALPDAHAKGIRTGKSSLNFKYQKGWPAPGVIRMSISSAGPGWRASSDKQWIMLSPATGKGDDEIGVGVLATSLEPGYHEGTVSLTPDGQGTEPAAISVSVMVLPEDPGTPELPHMAWDDYMDGNCKVCHLPKALMPSPDFMSRPEFCALCHNPSGMAAESLIGDGGHPVMVNITSGGSRRPSWGTVDKGPYSDRMATHLLGGSKVVCVTCHNVMYKPGDFGRTWELASSTDDMVFELAKGGWSQMGYLVPKVYVTDRLMPMPDRLAGLRAFMARPSSYTINDAEGTIKFKKPVRKGAYVYVTLSSPYLRVPTANNTLCYDCHSENTHQGLGCLACHIMHGTTNIMAVRGKVRTSSGALRSVVFRSYSGPGSFADSIGDPDGICEVCHDPGQGKYHKDNSDYIGKDCTSCHPHSLGFAAVEPVRTGP